MAIGHRHTRVGASRPPRNPALELIEHPHAGGQLIDTRQSSLVEQGTIPGGDAIPHTEIDERLGGLEAYQSIVLFCNDPQCGGTPDAVRRLLGRAPALMLSYHYLARHSDVRADPARDRRGRRHADRDGAPRGADLLLRRRRRPHVDEGARRRVNEERVREAAETGAETLTVACPFCTVMLDDGVKSRGDELRVVDVSTLLEESLDAAGSDESRLGGPLPD